MQIKFVVAMAATVLFLTTGFAQTGTITTYAGRPVPPDGTPARSIGFRPSGVVPDGSGGIYFTSTSGIFQVGIDGRTRLLATATNNQDPTALFLQPWDIIRDASGNLFVTSSNRIWRITPAGVISVIAGTGIEQGFGGDGGPAESARFSLTASLLLDGSGNLYVSDLGNHRVRRINPAGIVTTIAGNGSAGFGGDDGPATAAQLNRPQGLAIDRNGNLYVADTGNNRVRKVSPNGTIATIAGNGVNAFNGDNIPATGASLIGPQGLAVDRDGNLYIGEYYRVRKVTPDGVISTVVGDGTLGSDVVEGTPATSGPVLLPWDVAVDDFGNLYFATLTLVRKVTPDGIVHNLAGNGTDAFSGDNGPAIAAQFSRPASLATDIAGNLYIGDWANGRLRQVNPAGTISSLPPRSIQSEGLAVDSDGNVYYTRSGQHFVSRVTPDGIVTVVAGQTSAGFSGDGGPAVLAQLSHPSGLAMDLAGNLYIGDVDNRRIRKVSAGLMTTLVADVDPAGLAADRAGNIYFANGKTSTAYKVTPEGTLARIAGNLTAGFGGDGGPAIEAQLNFPQAVAVDSGGNLYIADGVNHRVRKVNSDGVITTVAGTGVAGYSGDGGPATSATMNVPQALALDTDGNLYIADSFIHVVRRIEHVSPRGVPFFVSGNGTRSLQTRGGTGPLVSGSVLIQADAGKAPPSGLAIFSMRQNGILISEGTVPAAQPFLSGRFYAEIDGGVNTGVAIANPSAQQAYVRFELTGPSGLVRDGSVIVPANGQIAAFLDQLPFLGTPPFRGTFTFYSNIPIGVIALRGLTNERGEFLMTTLPLLNLDVPANSASFTLPHFADGEGWASQIVLVNPGAPQLGGTLSFFDPSGNPLPVTIDGETRTRFTYSVPSAGYQRFVTSGLSSAMQVGSVVVTPDTFAPAPSGLLIFSFRKNGITVTEAGVPAVTTGTAFRVYAEAAGSLQSGLAVANPSNTPAVVTLSLLRMDGSPTGGTGALTVPPHGQVARFMSEIPGLSGLPSFQGILRISSETPLAVMGLRTRYNERGDFLITTTSPFDESGLVPTEAVFPHFADGGGYSTQFILYSGAPAQQGSGLLRMTSPSGQFLHVPMR